MPAGKMACWRRKANGRKPNRSRFLIPEEDILKKGTVEPDPKKNSCLGLKRFQIPEGSPNPNKATESKYGLTYMQIASQAAFKPSVCSKLHVLWLEHQEGMSRQDFKWCYDLHPS